MDSKDKHGTWIGGMYEKVGTLYSGIDGIISQDLLQYAETQFLTAGANVKQFTENQILATGANVIQFAEDQFSTTGANVKQFAEDQFSKTGANVKEFCSNFMQEVLSDLMKDSFLEKSQSEETVKCDCSSCETLEKEDDRCPKDAFSTSDNSDVASYSGFTIGKEMILEQNHIKVNVIPSKIPQADMSEKKDAGMKPSICRVDQSHDGGIGDQIDCQSLKSVLSQPSYSSSKGDRNGEPEPSVLDNLICRLNATVSSGLDESRILANKDDFTETCSGFFEVDESLTFSLLDGPDDSKADQTKDNHSRDTGLNSYPVLSSNKSSPSDFQVEQGKFENGWEFMEMAGYEDHPVESNEPQGMSPKQSLQPKESKIDCESCESDWEIV